MKETKEKRSITDLQKENEELKARTDFLQRMVNGLRLNNRELTQERNQLLTELDNIKNMTMFEFGNKYCASESLEADGHAFARSLGVGVRMTPEDIAEEEFISQGEQHYADTWNINCGDDF